MKHALFSFAIAVAAMLFVPPVAAQGAPEQTHPTLRAWIERDQMVGRMPESPERDAAGAALQRDIFAALQAARAAEDAKAAAGEQRGACMPPPGTTEVTSKEIGSWLYSRPPSEYGDTLLQVMLRFLAHRFPCP